MKDINKILLHFNKSEELTAESIQLAKKAALLELKFSPDQKLNVGDISYTKNDLIDLFAYYEDEENIQVIALRTIYTETTRLNHPSRIKFPVFPGEKFENEPLKTKFRKYIEECYGTALLNYLRTHQKSTISSRYVDLYNLFTYLDYFPLDYKEQVHLWLKRKISTDLQALVADKYHVKRPENVTTYYLFNSSFIRLCGIIGNDDEDFLILVLNTTIDFFNNYRYKRSGAAILNCFIEHRKLNHSPMNILVLDDNIKMFKKQNHVGNEGSGPSTWKIVWFVVVGLIFLSRVLISTSNSNRNPRPAFDYMNSPEYINSVESFKQQMDSARQGELNEILDSLKRGSKPGDSSYLVK